MTMLTTAIRRRRDARRKAELDHIEDLAREAERDAGCDCPDPYPLIRITSLTRTEAHHTTAHWPTCALLAGHHCIDHHEDP